MSLTSHAAYSESPVVQFMDETLPGLAARSNGIRVAFRQTIPQQEVVSLPQEYMRQSSLVGNAVERRLSWSLGAVPDDTPEQHGIRVVSLYQRALQRWNAASPEQIQAAETLMHAIGKGVVASAVGIVDSHGIADRTHAFFHDNDVEQQLARAAVGMARLDAAYHSGGHSLVETTFFGQPLQKRSVYAQHAVSNGIRRALDETPQPLLDDIIAQTQLAAGSPFGTLRETTAAGQARNSVVFPGSTALGGAEADIIVDGLLLDIKGTHRVRTMPTKDLRQLAGYLLLDGEDSHNIQEVGIYRTRNGHLFSVGADDFITMAGGRAPLAELREKFHEQVITPLEKDQRAIAA